jgi:branched-chain amino acid transport system ATP-binding protein
MALLELKGLTKHFGGLAAVDNLDLVVGSGEIVGLIGPNGAGKTTAFNLIAGFLPPTSGSVLFKREDITNLKPNKIAGMGVTRTFQLTTLFGDMTVADNLYIAVHLQAHPSFFGSIFHTPSTKSKEQKLRERTMALMDSMGLSELQDEVAMNLPHGHQRLLGIAMAIATNPEVVLLDEPVSGMNQEETTNTMRLINDIREEGITVLLVEHNMRTVMELCDRIAVLNYGNKIAEGTPKEISEDEEVIKAYLGDEDAA